MSVYPLVGLSLEAVGTHVDTQIVDDIIRELIIHSPTTTACFHQVELRRGSVLLSTITDRNDVILKGYSVKINPLTVLASLFFLGGGGYINLEA